MKKLLAMICVSVLVLVTVCPALADNADLAAYYAANEQKLDSNYTLALNAINNEDYEKAKKYLDICFAYCDAQGNPALFADLMLKRACIDVIEGGDDLALAELGAALAVQPDLADAYLVRTQIYNSMGMFQNAAADLSSYIDLTGDVSLYETLAQIYEADENYSAASQAYDLYAAALEAPDVETGYQAAVYQLLSGRYAEAEASFAKYAEDELYGAAALYNMGVSRMNQEKYAEAKEAFDQCLKKGGLYEGLYYNTGVCALLIEDWDAAAEAFAQSIAAEPFVSDARYNLGVAEMQRGEYEAAVSAFSTLIAEEEAVKDDVYYFRALCNAALGNLEAALADYTLCIEHGFSLGQSYYQRSQVYAAMGDEAHQVEDLENSLKYMN